MELRPLERGDIPHLETMLRDYLRETYASEWCVSATTLESGIADGAVRFAVAVNSPGKLVGFVAWFDSYDLHHCVRGATIVDLYVKPAFRGHALGVRLLAAAATEIGRRGGTFLRGTAVADDGIRELYARSAACSDTVECTLSGRAFRHLAGLVAAPARQIARSLPDVSWNYEA